ncbi:DUF1206 domain-containing protein [Corynebacterium cystitidis]|uniref:DUF1206 domain-containing protein n=1 Tax=Corynebacterium cystitidis DSM 20524 TaxID=1121357 RepID=A0A1H9UNB6_9CORY|nr:DUF1206 domain-containing protein [Corynebacterium cystitidis]WJY81048.1 hypothetical protein CCYS_00320 [Corynebacterium cystitidis DSM 20524]SES10829.1 protein of unknown function [Corynebacterium cystitidis DSM 20524]SNV90417.1 Domain of Uncharacterised Function (DUF1206) [Corynebacterium cystitidis]
MSTVHQVNNLQRLSTHVQQNRFYLLFVRVGLITFGLVYGLLGILVAQIAFSGGLSENPASFHTVLAAVARQPFGHLLLLVAASGLGVIAVWQAIEALVGYAHLKGIRRFNRRMSSTGRAVIYASLSAFAVMIALQVPLRGADWPGLVDEALSRPGGRLTVLIVGVVMMGIGFGQIGRGLGRIFVDEFRGPVAKWVVVAGMIGYSMLGSSLILIGGLVAWSSISAVPEYAGTMNDAVRFLVGLPLGRVMGALVAAGFWSFAMFCLMWSTQPLHATHGQKSGG